MRSRNGCITGRKLAVALNKIDRASPEELLTSARILGDRADFAAVFMISATRKDGVGDVLSWLAGEVPRGPWLFPEDQVSDLPVRVIAAEITRGRLMLRLHEEIPYRLTVESEGWTERKDGSVRIEQVVHVAREGHKGMIVGRRGRVIRQVSAEARRGDRRVSRSRGAPLPSGEGASRLGGRRQPLHCLRDLRLTPQLQRRNEWPVSAQIFGLVPISGVSALQAFLRLSSHGEIPRPVRSW